MTAPLKIRPVTEPVEECHGCKGLGSVECEDCHGEGSRDCECDACDSKGYYACDVCHGFACLAAARAWESDQVLPLIPSDVLRGILRLAPHLDAAGLPRYSVRVEGCNAQPVIHVETRRDDSEAEALLADTGGFVLSSGGGVWVRERQIAGHA